MRVIYNGVDTDKFRSGNRQRRPGEPFRLLYVGSWMARKGVDLLAPIMRELGDGFELRYTGGKAAERDKPGMPTNMHDTGRLKSDEAVVEAMQDVDALLFPSRSEGFGLVAAEAMACGLPVIATRGSSLVEVVENGVTGILCSKDDVATFVAGARTLKKDPERTHRMAEAARAVVLARFARGDMIDAYVKLYRALEHP
jgi:glycosyltransferase involved in cell wall biosynthesis